MKGFATLEGTAKYRARFEGRLDSAHFRERRGLWFSSIGIGSYLGNPDEGTDALYHEALKEAVRSGVNVIDSAVNYRAQRSERVFGRALAALVDAGEFTREELILCTKGGFLPFDGSYPEDAAGYFQKKYIEPGLLKPEDIVQGCHAMTPAYLEDQLSLSLKNLGVAAVDIYYLHNPETQLAVVPRGDFLNRMRSAFSWMEEKVREGKIRMYGTATWSGYRVRPEKKDHLSLEEIHCIAREAGGPDHHFRVLQLPVSLAMPEAWLLENQRYGANLVPLLEIARKNGMAVIGSGSLLQGKLTGTMPDYFTPFFPSLEKPAQRALQFARSLPGITTSLVGMKNSAHVRENLETAKVPVMPEEEIIRLFQSATR